jgi:hypothetical protein
MKARDLAIKTYVSFFFKNYFRSHRYLREILTILIFHIFFWGFLYTDKPDDMIWSVLAVLGILLNMVTVSSLFFFEKGNSLYFPLVRPGGRVKFLLSKILLIISIDLFWVLLFSLIYGLRFLEGSYFLQLPLRLLLMTLLLILSTSILSLSFSYKIWTVWIVMLLIVFGGILNKSALFPIQSFSQSYVLLTFLLPPLLEIIYSAVTLEFPFWRNLFLLTSLLQIGFYLWLNIQLIQKKDFI